MVMLQKSFFGCFVFGRALNNLPKVTINVNGIVTVFQAITNQLIYNIANT